MNFKDHNTVVFDLETTSAKTDSARIVQLGMLYMPRAGEPQHYNIIVNPEVPIDPKATEVHGISDQDVEDKPIFRDVAELVFRIMEQSSVVITYNGNRFDLPILTRELESCGFKFDVSSKHIIDVYSIVTRIHPRTLPAMIKLYFGHEPDDAHDALADTLNTFNLLTRMIEVHNEIPKTVKEIALYANNDKPILDLSGFFAYNDDMKIIFGTGKHFGEMVSLENHRSYLQWMVERGNFGQQTREIALKFLNNQITN